ncbi:MAG: HDOD domain-containing protein [Candidatus Latescibacterota bacterium]
MKHFDRILKSIDYLPPFPVVVTKSIALMRNPDVSMDEIAEVIKFDQSITANLLRFCNSSYVGLRRPIINVRDAVIFLGINHLKNMLIITGARSYFQMQKPGYYLRAGGLWSHSLAASLLSTRFGPLFPKSDADAVFIAALLHDVGKIVLNEFVEHEYKRIQETIEREQITFFEAERKILGFDHADIGFRILLLWEFPKEVADAVRIHHDPLKPDDTALADIVKFSNILTRIMGSGVAADRFEKQQFVDLCQRNGINPEMFDSSSTEMIEEIKRVESEFGYL